jgi:hypothetical protein
MSGGHGASRRRSYGKRQKDMRERQSADMSVDLEGPARWPRGSSWESDRQGSSSPWSGAQQRAAQQGAAQQRGAQTSQPGSSH